MGITETTSDELATKIENGEILSKLERQVAAFIIRDYRRHQSARAAGGKKSRGGGRPKDKNPSKSAEYQRNRRAKLKPKVEPE